MKRSLAGAAALALLLCASSALAQPNIGSPGSVTPLQGIAYGAVGAPPTPVTNANPLPVNCATCTGGSGGASGVANAAAPTRTEGQTGVAPSYDLSGAQRVTLGSGAATAARQDTANASLAAIQASAANTGTVPIGCALIGSTSGAAAPCITTPYVAASAWVKGSASTTGTGATTLLAAAGAGIKNYAVSLQCSNTSATNVLVTLNDSAASSFICPAGSGNNPVFGIPIATAVNTALTFTSSAAATTVSVNVQGFTGS